MSKRALNRDVVALRARATAAEASLNKALAEVVIYRRAVAEAAEEAQRAHRAGDLPALENALAALLASARSKT